VQATCTVVTFPVAVPLPFETLQFCVGLEGCVETVTLYVAPLLSGVEKVKLPLLLTEKLLPPLSCRVSPVPAKPETVPPIVYVTGGGVPPLELLLLHAIRQDVATRARARRQGFTGSSTRCPGDGLSKRSG
jgi:hypothetical protein